MKRAIAGRDVEAIGLGCMELSHGYGTPPSPEDAARLLHRALDLGYDHLDTARVYGAGRNEALIGEALAGRRNAFFLASKTGIVFQGDRRGTDCSPESIRRAVDESLTALRTDHIDLYYMHRRDFAVPIEESVGAMAELIAAGKIGAIGLSEMSAETLRRAAAIHPIAAMQTEYSPWTRNAEIAVLEACRELGTTFVAFSPLARGVLADGLRDATTLDDMDIRRRMPRFAAEHWAHNRMLAEQFNAIAAGQQLSPAQLSLAWVLSRGEHVVAIPGTTQIAHLEDNAARRDWPLPAAVAAEIDALINQRTVSGPRYDEKMQPTIDTEEFA